MKTIITNGIVVAYDKSMQADISIEEGIITEIAECIDKSNATIVDANNCYILPGGVDMHTSLSLDSKNAFSISTFRANSLAALYGGNTTIIEEVENLKPSSRESFSHYLSALKGNAFCDYSLHQNFQDKEYDEETIKKVTQNGFPSYCLKMNGQNELSDQEILDLLRIASPYGATTFIDCESKVAIKLLEDLHIHKKRTTPYALATTHPNWTESEAFIRLCNLARAGGFTLALESVTTKEVVDILYRQVNEGLPVTMLTSPHYLILNDDNYLTNQVNDDKPYKFCVSPPLRKSEDIDALWKAIRDGLIHCIVSRHNGTHLTHKKNFSKDIFNVPKGLPGVELRLPLLYTFGVVKGRISINKLVEITATHVTRIAGLRNKGRIEAGTDADIVIFDPHKKKTISKNELHDTCDYSPYEGMELQGFARDVFLRGHHVIENFKLKDEIPHGKLALRKAVSMR